MIYTSVTYEFKTIPPLNEIPIEENTKEILNLRYFMEFKRDNFKESDFKHLCRRVAKVVASAEYNYYKENDKITKSTLNKIINLEDSIYNDMVSHRFLFNSPALFSAGNGQIAYDETPLCHFAYRKDWLNERGLHEGDLRVVCARGDSMEPTIGDKDYLLVNTAEKEPKDGHIYVIRSCDMLWVKRIQRLLDGSLLLISDNKIYPPMPLKLDEASDIEIIGKVVNSSKNFY